MFWLYLKTAEGGSKRTDDGIWHDPRRLGLRRPRLDRQPASASGRVSRLKLSMAVSTEVGSTSRKIALNVLIRSTKPSGRTGCRIDPLCRYVASCAPPGLSVLHVLRHPPHRGFRGKQIAGRVDGDAFAHGAFGR